MSLELTVAFALESELLKNKAEAITKKQRIVTKFSMERLQKMMRNHASIFCMVNFIFVNMLQGLEFPLSKMCI